MGMMAVLSTRGFIRETGRGAKEPLKNAARWYFSELSEEVVFLMFFAKASIL
jgi:hypothetical protein